MREREREAFTRTHTEEHEKKNVTSLWWWDKYIMFPNSYNSCLKVVFCAPRCLV